MPSIVHIIETAVLLFAAYQVGWFAGYLARRLRTPKATATVVQPATTASVVGTVPVEPVTVNAPQPAIPVVSSVPTEAVTAEVKTPTLEPAIAAALAETAAAETAERVAAELAAMSAPPKPGVLPQDFLDGLESAMLSDAGTGPATERTDAVLSDEVTPFVPVLGGSLPISSERPFAAPEPKAAVPLPGFAELLAQAVPQPVSISVEPLALPEMPRDIDPAIVMASVMRDEPEEATIIEGVAVAASTPSLEQVVPPVASLPPFEIRTVEQPVTAKASPLTIEAEPEPEITWEALTKVAAPKVPEPQAEPTIQPTVPPVVMPRTAPAQPQAAAAAPAPPLEPTPAPSFRARPDLRPASRPGELWSKRAEQNAAPTPAAPPELPAAKPVISPVPRREVPAAVDKSAEEAAMRSVEGGWNDRKPVRVPIKDLPEGVDR